MKKIKVTAKEEDGILCMIEYFINNDNGFLTRYHKRITQAELIKLSQTIINKDF